MKTLVLFLTLFFVFGCGNSSEASKQQEKPQTTQSTKNDITYERKNIHVGAKKINVEIADTNERRSHGLMFRTSMPEDEGMLFIFDTPQPLEFWMRNTKIPLAIAFISPDLTILNIEEMVPASDIDQDPPRYPSKGIALYALEMNKGWFARNKISVGTKIKLQ
jgi:uncharacterized protein